VNNVDMLMMSPSRLNTTVQWLAHFPN